MNNRLWLVVAAAVALAIAGTAAAQERGRVTRTGNNTYELRTAEGRSFIVTTRACGAFPAPLDEAILFGDSPATLLFPKGSSGSSSLASQRCEVRDVRRMTSPRPSNSPAGDSPGATASGPIRYVNPFAAFSEGWREAQRRQEEQRRADEELELLRREDARDAAHHEMEMARLRAEIERLKQETAALAPPKQEDPLSFPLRWRSLTHGSFHAVQIIGDHVYVINELPAQMTSAGSFLNIDFATAPNGGYAGIVHRGDACTAEGPTSMQKVCRLEYPATITSFSSTRIEGELDGWAAEARFDCGRCTITGPRVKEKFVWVPESVR